MTGPFWGLLAAVVILSASAVFVWRPIRLAWRRPRFAQAQRDFHWQRERLEAKFVQLAQAHGKPNGPRWTNCEFDDDVAYVRNRYTGELSAFVAVGISIGDADEEANDGLDPMGGYRAATAVFRFDRDHWETDGRAIFNLSPSETIRFYQHDLEIVDQELAQ